MTVKTSYRGMVRVNNVKSKHHGAVAKMEDYTWRDGVCSGVLRIDGKRVYLSIKSLDEINDTEAKKIMSDIGVGVKQGKLTSIVQITNADGQSVFMSPMTDKQAMEVAREHKIKNTTDTVSIWKLSGHIANPRIIADFVTA